MGKQNNETDEWVTFALIFTRHFTVRCSLRIILLTGIFLTAFNLINYFDEKLFHEFSMQRSSFSFLINENFIERKKTLISIFSISYSTLYFCSNSMCTITRKKKKKKKGSCSDSTVYLTVGSVQEKEMVEAVTCDRSLTCFQITVSRTIKKENLLIDNILNGRSYRTVFKRRFLTIPISLLEFSYLFVPFLTFIKHFFLFPLHLILLSLSHIYK